MRTPMVKAVRAPCERWQEPALRLSCAWRPLPGRMTTCVLGARRGWGVGSWSRVVRAPYSGTYAMGSGDTLCNLAYAERFTGQVVRLLSSVGHWASSTHGRLGGSCRVDASA